MVDDEVKSRLKLQARQLELFFNRLISWSHRLIVSPSFGFGPFVLSKLKLDKFELTLSRALK